jgi:membrane protease subunit HflK
MSEIRPRQQPSGAIPEGPQADAGHQALSDALRWVFRLVPVAMAAIVLLFLSTGVYQVDPSEKALLIRFGEIIQEQEPGWYFKWPYPIDDTFIVSAKTFTFNTGQMFMYRAGAADRPPAPAPMAEALDPGVDGYVLTGDRQIFHLQIAVQYVIQNPKALYLTLGGAELFPTTLRGEPSKEFQTFFRSVLAPVLVKTVGGYPVDEVYHTGRRIPGQIQDALNAEFRRLNVGLAAVNVEIKKAEPPVGVKPAFDLVMQAGNVRQSQINTAQQEATSLVSESQSQAVEIKNEADRYKVAQVEDAKARKEVLENYQKQYGLTPGMTQYPPALVTALEIRRIEAVKDLLSQAEEVFLVTYDPENPNKQVRLRITRDPEAIKDLAKTIKEREALLKGRLGE